MIQISKNKIIPLYYKISDDGIPHDWVGIMKESIKSNGPIFSAQRMVKEYIQKFYATALKALAVK
jgi:glycogen phosphorylase